MQDGEAKAAFVALTTRTGKVLFVFFGGGGCIPSLF